MRLGNLSCSQTRWPHGQSDPSTVIEQRLFRYWVSGQQSDSCAFLCNGGYADKRRVSRGEWERDWGTEEGSGYGCSCVWTLTLLFHHWEESTRRTVQFPLYCFWALLKWIVRFSRNVEIGFWRYWSLRWWKRWYYFILSGLNYYVLTSKNKYNVLISYF